MLSGAAERVNSGALLRKATSLALVEFTVELSSEGAVLEGGEEGVQLGEVVAGRAREELRAAQAQILRTF